MPTRHRRIGLVVDDEISAALELVRAGNPERERADATLARDAILEGAGFAALLALVDRSTEHDGSRAARLLVELQALLEEALPADIMKHLVRSVELSRGKAAAAQRRQRQLALLASPNLHGHAAIDYADTFDALDATD